MLLKLYVVFLMLLFFLIFFFKFLIFINFLFWLRSNKLQIDRYDMERQWFVGHVVVPDKVSSRVK